MISLIDSDRDRQKHWWLPEAGFPQQIAHLLGAPLQASGQPPRRWREFQAVFQPLAPLPPPTAPPAAPAATYRYLIRLDRRGSQLSCWRRYPEGLGWQRRCGPMPLAQFVRRFSEPLSSLP